MNIETRIETLEWELIQHGGTAKNWIELAHAVALVDYKSKTARINAVSIIYERALRAMPYSYKLWVTYLAYRQTEITNQVCSSSQRFQSIRALYERAVQQLPTMPMLWVQFLDFVMFDHEQGSAFHPRLTMVRHLICQSLKALPVTQHHHIWSLMKRWTKEKFVPSEVIKAFWRVYLLFDSSLRQRRNYFRFLMERGHMSDVVSEWHAFFFAHYCERTGSLRDDTMGGGASGLFHEPDMWDAMQIAFQRKGWRCDVPLDQLDTMVDYGASKTTSSTAFLLSYSLFLCGQGEFQRGRKRVRDLLTAAPDATSFSSVFEAAVEVEDELVESYAHQFAPGKISEKVSRECCDTFFGLEAHRNPLFHLRRLSEEHDLLLNQAQLRNVPDSVPLWLKRVELFQEKVAEGMSSVDNVVTLWKQAIEKCAQGMNVVDVSVMQLYAGFAEFLLDQSRVSAAISVLEEGAWSVRFSDSAANADLLGFLMEVQLLSSNGSEISKRSVAETVLSKLRPSGTAVAGHKRNRRGLLALSEPTSSLVQSPLPWLLAIDSLWMYSTADAAQRAIEEFSHHASFTAEAAAHLSYQLYTKGFVQPAIKLLEQGLVQFKEHPIALLFLISQYISLLCLHYGKDLPLDMFRELSQMVLHEAANTIVDASLLTVDVMMSCAAVETRHGLYRNALHLCCTAASLALSRLGSDPLQTPLLSGLVERTLETAMMCKGIQEVRLAANELISALGGASGFVLHRIVVHWAALERRCGYVANAHTILEAYATTQDPDSSYGATYYTLWESLCRTIEEVEVVLRCRQQSKILHNKKK